MARSYTAHGIDARKASQGIRKVFCQTRSYSASGVVGRGAQLGPENDGQANHPWRHRPQ